MLDIDKVFAKGEKTFFTYKNLKKEVEVLKGVCLKGGDVFCDSLLNEASFGSLSGVFSLAPENVINSEVLALLTETSKKTYSEIRTLKGGSFLFVRVDSLVEPGAPGLYEYWGFIEGLALENKFNLFF